MDEDAIRREALEASRSLAEAEQLAREMPRIVWGEKTTCATCENLTGAYKQYSDGKQVPICGACYLREMDEYAARRPERRGKE